MKAATTLLVALVVISLAAGPVSAAKKTYSHQEYFEHYEGTATCLECHEQEATDFFHSQHYQWRGEAPNVINADGRMLGKFNTMNDFCTNPLPSWIGNAANEDGKVIAQGCSKCHAGLGLKPESKISRAQLENIDCLICHASGYRRDAFQDENGAWEWRPILWKNQRGLDSVSKRITQPRRKSCLRCHSGAGGGPNYKRGDLEYVLGETTSDYDVHMGTDGQDMTCADCHGGTRHRMRGRGADLAGTDNPDQPLACTTCHDAAPHGVVVLDRHAERVDCTVCHIPDFARTDPTDMIRDWSVPKHHPKAKKWSATITFGQNVVPEYAWWGGDSRLSPMGEKVKTDDDGVVPIMVPVGKRKDKSSKIYAFKVHRARLPVLQEERWLVPIAVDEFFIDGDMEKAVHEGAESAYGLHEAEYEWVDTVRWMGIFHGVRPAGQALQCLDCHREGGRMDWRALGYKKDPLLDAMD
ncbi:MAG: hypothetical protein GY838_06805 [bacterium]|nr:hypothetical protein [bacterium]